MKIIVRRRTKEEPMAASLVVKFTVKSVMQQNRIMFRLALLLKAILIALSMVF